LKLKKEQEKGKKGRWQETEEGQNRNPAGEGRSVRLFRASVITKAIGEVCCVLHPHAEVRGGSRYPPPAKEATNSLQAEKEWIFV